MGYELFSCFLLWTVLALNTPHTIHAYNRQDLLQNVLHVTMIKRKKIYGIFLFIPISSSEISLYNCFNSTRGHIESKFCNCHLTKSDLWFSWDLIYTVVIKEIRHRFTRPQHILMLKIFNQEMVFRVSQNTSIMAPNRGINQVGSRS